MLFDPATVEAVRDLAPVWLVVLFAVLSFLGSTVYQVPMLYLWYALEARDRVATWMGIVVGGYAFRSLLKNLNDIDRPPVDSPMDPASFPALVRPIYEHPAEISTTSFPSGHAIAATVLWGLLVIDTDIGTRRQRISVAATVVFIVAASRVVLAAHYIEDVVAGVAFGLLFLGGALFVRDRGPNPVAAVFTLAACVSLVVLSFTPSTTSNVTLGVSVGVLAMVYSPMLVSRIDDRCRYTAPVGFALAITVGVVAFVLLETVGSLLMASAMLGAVGYWLPRQPAIRSVVPFAGRNTTVGQ